MPSRQFHSAAKEYLYKRYITGDPEAERAYEDEFVNMEIARTIYDLRTRAGLTQQELPA